MNDLKFAVRQLLKHPGFAAVAVLQEGDDFVFGDGSVRR
jgi:hypothetical protein